MPLAVILDSDPDGHGAQVQARFLSVAPTGWTCDVRSTAIGVEPVLTQALADGARLFIWCMTGVWSFNSLWQRAWQAGALVVAAHGSNANGAYLSTPPSLWEYLVTVGGEDLDDNDPNDDRSYGPGLMLDSEDLSGATEESWSTPIVAALLAKAYSEGVPSSLPDGTASERRARLREALSVVLQACTDYPAWTPQRGFGHVSPLADVITGVPEALPVVIQVVAEPVPPAPPAQPVMLVLLDALITRLRAHAEALGCPAESIVRGRFGSAGGLDLGIVRPPGLAVFLVPGDMAMVTAAGTALDDPAFTLVVGVAAPPSTDTAVALAGAYEVARLVPGILAPGFCPVWAADAIEPLSITSDRALVAITGLVYDRGVTE